jgi:pimeloyl-ACP methyl ester carboxylesterase
LYTDAVGFATSSLTSIDRSAYPFTSRWIDLSAGRMHYVDEGKGEPLLFIHGTPTWSFEWRQLIQAFAPHYRCIAPDHIGFGLSDRPRGFAYTPEAHAQNLAEFVEKLSPEPFTLIVHDYGGPIGLPVCLRHPERVTRLILLNTWMWSFAGDPEMEKKARIAGGSLGRFLYRWANFSLRVLMPYAYADKKKLTPERSIVSIWSVSRIGGLGWRCCGRWRTQSSDPAATTTLSGSSGTSCAAGRR